MKNLLILTLSALFLGAQQMPPSAVRYTEVRERQVSGQLVLPGSVESNTVSLVASEVAGLVIEYPVEEGDTVKTGHTLAVLNRRSLELRLHAAEGQLKEAEARQKLAQRNFERAKELFDSKVFSQQQLDDTFYEFNAWQGRIDNLKAEIDRIRYDIESGTITAPFDGVVVKKHTELGQWLAVGDPVVELLSLDQLDVVVNIPEQYYPAIRAGAAVRVAFEALPGTNIAGKIHAIIPRADPQARTFPVKVRIPDRTGRIGVGMLAQVSLPGGGARRATIVPKDAVVIRGNERLVYLMNGDNTVSPVTVQTGNGVGAWIEVQGALEAGQRVVTRGNERLRPGQLVRGDPIEYELP
jgi:RND family efflux transporter MFP subunit